MKEKAFFTIMPVTAYLLVAAFYPAPALAAMSCSSCHQMPPLDAPARNPKTGGTRGNHQSHLPPNAAAASCSNCHKDTAVFTTGHRDGVISFAPSIRNSPATGRYIVGGLPVPFRNQTSRPVNGSCSNVSCHFERETPQWGSALLGAASTTTCSTCHDARPTTLSHQKHLKFLGEGVDICGTCHGDNYAAKERPFDHATSAGRPIRIDLTGNRGSAQATYDGSRTKFLPSQSGSRTPGSCSNLSCHSNGQTPPVYATPRWGSSLGCTACHPNLSGAHSKHVGNLLADITFYNYTANSSTGNDTVTGWSYRFGCSTCHPVDPAKHADGTIEVELNAIMGGSTLRAKNTGAVVNGTLGAGTATCTAVYCHGDGKNGPASTTPAWNTVFTGDRCAKCHGNSPVTGAHAAHVVGIHYNDIYNGVSGKLAAAGSGNASHGVAGQSTTINCHLCHNATVTSTANDKNPACAACHDGTKATLRGNASIANLSRHINGRVDLVFKNMTVISKAQLRPANFGSYSAASRYWSRNGGNYKKGAGAFDTARYGLGSAVWNAGTCSNIACHMGSPANWDTTLNCSGCHTRL